MKPLKWIILHGARIGLEVMCRINKEEFKKVPQTGPLLICSNHTGSVEAPIIYTQLAPRPAVGLAKIEAWDNWFLNIVFTAWEMVPIRRGEADMEAMRKSIDILKQGNILGIAPEGTRNRTGKLIRAQPGVVTLAQHSKAPILPMANWGGENFRSNLKRLRRTDFHVNVGRPFHLKLDGLRVNADLRQKIADDIMYQVAALLPEEYRGYYSDLSQASTEYFEFI
jgi:1-acyl-sn-glycerol-3-phosphate acyltransferase